jgi:hypothetical protein
MRFWHKQNDVVNKNALAATLLSKEGGGWVTEATILEGTI